MNTKVKNMLYCALFACLIAILAQIQIALPTLVPITLQTLGVYLVSLLLKPKLAFISTLIYVFMGAIGLPVFGGFSGGLASLLGPSGGYIFSFPIMALVIALIVKRNEKLSFKIIALIIGTAVCYLIGTLWFIYVTNTSLIPALTMCVIPFLPGDTLKIIISIILANRLNSKIAN